MKSYAEALQKLNEADRSKEKISAVEAFASAAASDPDGVFLPPKDCTCPCTPHRQLTLRRQLTMPS